ncbi:MAG: hypothetical protein ACKOXK_00150 [Chakrabartia sp.]
MLASIIIWGSALALYLAFLAFYDGRKRPLSKAEVDDFLADIAPRLRETGNDPEVMRAFLEADDGREFIMLNMVRTPAGPVTHPETGETLSGKEWLERYSTPFVKGLMRRGGHPLYVGRKVAGYVDAWGVSDDPAWTMTSTMRYRSRRDLVAMVRDPAFRGAHANKLLGIDMTFSFPTQKMVAFYASPRITMALALALAAALIQLAL